jgi:hypothetical protein
MDVERHLLELDSTRRDPKDELTFLSFFPGLRSRVLLRYREIDAGFAAEILPSLEAWDRSGVTEIQSRAVSNFVLLQPDDLLARVLMDAPIHLVFGRVLLMAYLATAGCAVTRALLACEAYRKRHGRGPESLGPACVEAGIELPVDVATGAPLSYRAEGDVPVVWAAGLDRRDDGGTEPYSIDEDFIGNDRRLATDLVARPGDTRSLATAR